MTDHKQGMESIKKDKEYIRKNTKQEDNKFVFNILIIILHVNDLNSLVKIQRLWYWKKT